MPDNIPNTEQTWSNVIANARLCVEGIKLDLQRATEQVDAAIQGRRRWREQQLQLAYEPFRAKIEQELGIDFTLQHTGGGCMALRADAGLVRLTITDYGDGDLSHPLATRGWWIGFELPDAPWSGRQESIVGDPDARTAGDMVRFVAHAVSGYLRGDRFEVSAPRDDYDDGIPRIDYDVR